MIGRLKDLAFTRTGEQIVSFSTGSDFTEEFDALFGVDVDIEIKKHREKRSKYANSYCWVLCGKIADKLADEDPKMNKDEVYREAIRTAGAYKDVPDLDPRDAKMLRTGWQMNGTGWITEQVDVSPDGKRVTVRFYYGSSWYDTKQMSRLIDCLIEDCRALGIPTETPDQIAEIKSMWEPTQKGFFT